MGAILSALKSLGMGLNTTPRDSEWRCGDAPPEDVMACPSYYPLSRWHFECRDQSVLTVFERLREQLSAEQYMHVHILPAIHTFKCCISTPNGRPVMSHDLFGLAWDLTGADSIFDVRIWRKMPSCSSPLIVEFNRLHGAFDPPNLIFQRCKQLLQFDLEPGIISDDL